MATRRSEDKPSRRTQAASPTAQAPVTTARPSRTGGAAARAPAVPAPPAATPARRPRARAGASVAESPPACSPAVEDSVKAESFWRAGLRALDNVRHDVQRRQASVIETLLGIPPTATAAPESRLGLSGLPGLDAFGLRKFEDVFDQRVAAALERLGMPTREEVLALHEKLDRVLAQLERLGAQAEAAAQAATPAKPARPTAKTPRAAARTRQPR